MYNNKRSDNNKTKNYKKVEEFEMNRINAIDLDEEIVELEDRVDTIIMYTQLVIETKMYEDDEIVDEFGPIVAKTYEEVVDSYTDELKELATCIYACLKVIEAPDDFFGKYLNKLKAIESKIIKLKEMFTFVANEMEVTLNV